MAEPSPIPLFRHYPALESGLPWVQLANLPTPIDRLPRLERELGIRALYVKRDDISAAPYGGGKPRKLEFLLADALAEQRSRVVTWGGVGSNQAVAAAAYGQRLGLDVTLLLLPQRPNAHIRDQLLADILFGAELLLMQTQARAEQTAAKLAEDRGESRGAYVIPIGGSSPLGNAGFVNAALELDEQISQGVLSEPDVLYTAMGTMGSAVGLAIGLAAKGRKTRVVAVRASNVDASTIAKFRALFDETVAYLQERHPSFPKVRFEDANVELDGTQLGNGYGRPTPKAQQAVALTRKLSKLRLETTYTGKAFAALVNDAPKLQEQSVLFWNTHNSHPLDTEGVDTAHVPGNFKGYLNAR
jgi:D-cysteine desulfhydrase